MSLQQLKLVLSAGVALLAVGATTPALAQASDGSATGDIVVTARRTEERLQDVPISITVFNQEQLSNRNIVTSADLGAYTPSLSVNQRYGPEKASFAIRGFVQDSGTAPSVGVYFADVVAPRVFTTTVAGGMAPTGSFMDLQNVQVLKGPQGTLFGLNTTGGAVLLVPNKPTDRLEGNIEGSLGDYNLRRLQGVINIPLSDTFKVRFAADRQKRDGYNHNLSGVGPKAYNDVNYFAARMSIVGDLAPNLENYTIATYSNSFGVGAGNRPELCNPALQSASFIGASACAQIATRIQRGDGPLDVDVNNPNPFIKIRHWQVINTTTWQASDTLTVKNITSYSEFREASSLSIYGDHFKTTGVTFPAGIPYQYVVINPTPGYDNSSESNFTEEFQLQGKSGDGKLTWQAGAYLEMDRPLGWSATDSAILLDCSDLTAGCKNPLGAGQISHAKNKGSFDSKALYAQATYDITDTLSLTGGFRYTWDKTRVDTQSTRIRIATTGNVQTCNDVSRFHTVTGAALVVADETQCFDTLRTSSSAPTWLINLDYKPIPDVMVYAKYARGYRQGGVSSLFIGFRDGWKPEKVDTYEAGVKSSFHGAVPGYFNVTGFYNNFSNQQIVANGIADTVRFPGFAGGGTIVNAGKSRIWGFEADASATFFDSLRLDANYAYLNTKITQIDSNIAVPQFAPYKQIIVSSFEGDPLAYAPKNKITLTGTYTLPLDQSIGKVSLAATFTHTDKLLSTRGTAPQLLFLPPNDLLNLNANWDGVAGTPIDLAFFMTNVTNKHYIVAPGGAWGSGFETAYYNAPRMFGFRLRYRFGD